LLVSVVTFDPHFATNGGYSIQKREETKGTEKKRENGVSTTARNTGVKALLLSNQ
jgi:hypothetical protein